MAYHNWWAVPLTATLASTPILWAISILRRIGGHGRLSSLLTGCYLVPTLSMAGLNTASQLVPLSLPVWVNSLMLLVVLGSAWIYYQSVKDADVGQAPTSKKTRPFAWNSA